MKNTILFYFIIKPIYKSLKFINFYIDNWGISIIIITIIIKIITYPLIKKQYISTIKINMIKPEIDKINNTYEDKKIANEKIMDLYKEKNINPIQNILLLIIQIPIFFSLYYILISSKEFVNANFILWINDLSSKDPYFILPVLMGISIFFIQKESNIFNNNKNNNYLLIIIPIIFVLCFLYIPSGLVLYYLTNNIVTILQQKIIYNEYIKLNK